MNAKNHRLHPIGPIVRKCGKKRLFVRLEFDQIDLGVQSEKYRIFYLSSKRDQLYTQNYQHEAPKYLQLFVSLNVIILQYLQD